MYLALIFTPLINFMCLSFFGRFIGKYGSKLTSVLFMLVSTILAIVSFFQVGLKQNPHYITLGT